MFELRFPLAEIPHWASRYSFPGEDRLAERVAPAVRARGYLTRAEFLALCKWKTPRTSKRCALNSSQHIRHTTHLCFTTADDGAKSSILPRLVGADAPTESLLLPFCAPHQ